MSQRTDKKRRVWIILNITAIIAVITFIFSRSSLSMSSSAEESASFMKMFLPFLEFIFGKGNVTEHLVRKLAHLFEFAVLGALLQSLHFLIKKRLQFAVLFFNLFVAVCDETVQIFSRRGSQVQDVWIDFAGGLIGILFVCALNRLILFLHCKKEGEEISKKQKIS